MTSPFVNLNYFTFLSTFETLKVDTRKAYMRQKRNIITLYLNILFCKKIYIYISITYFFTKHQNQTNPCKKSCKKAPLLF